jgi:hypothetical protein
MEDMQKVSFGIQYVAQELKDSWRTWVKEQAAINGQYVPTWNAFTHRMLEALGSEAERLQDAFDRLKSIRQGNKTPIELLTRFKPLWRETQQFTEPRQINDFVSALHPRIRQVMSSTGTRTFNRLSDAEARASSIWRSLDKDRMSSPTPDDRQKGEKGPSHSRRSSNGGSRARKAQRGPPGANQAKGSGSSDPPQKKSLAETECYHCHNLGHTKDYCKQNPEATYGKGGKGGKGTKAPSQGQSKNGRGGKT